jgi:transcriptional regulator with XRE-family HTH domain
MEQAEDQVEEQADPFAGLGKALVRLRKRAGFATQLGASEALNIDKGQLSRWENEVPRPSLENLARLLAGYGASVADLAVALEAAPSESPAPTAGQGLGPSDADLLRSLAEAIRRVEGRQGETESRVDRIERGLEAAAPPVPKSRD